MSLCFTTTAMARPELIERTYGSFKENMSGIDWGSTTLFVNIEPLPDANAVNSVIEVCKQFFGRVVTRTPKEANFTKALSWCWNQVNTDYVLHLEDDWVLTSKIEFKDLLKLFVNDKTKQVVLRAYPYEYDKMCLSPSVIRGSWVKRFEFDFNLNPEVQLRKSWVRPEYINVPHNNIVVKDIGRKWIESSDYKKPGHKASFTSWEKK